MTFKLYYTNRGISIPDTGVNMCKALEVVVVWGKLSMCSRRWKHLEKGSSIRMSGEVGRDFE